MNASCRRQHGRARLRRGGFPVPRSHAAVLLAVILSTACATVRPEAPPSDPASTAGVLHACGGGDLGFCRGFVEAAFSSVYAEGRLCPPPLEFDDVSRVVLEALRHAEPGSAAIVPAESAIRAAWPCPAQPNVPRIFAANSAA